MDIIERLPYRNNQYMKDYCQSLLNAIEGTKMVKKGKNIEVSESVVDKIKRSIEYYDSEDEVELEDQFSYRDYQVDIINKASAILDMSGFVYLAMEVRTGKTLTALGICSKINAKNVLFITKLKAISSIKSDYELLNPDFFLEVVNYESLHKAFKANWDTIVIDEAHSLGAFPKPSGRALDVKEIIKAYQPRVILMSGTPTPESFSQMYHQVYAIPGNPFHKYRNFYKFANEYVDVKQIKISGHTINDYKRGHESILKEMEPFTINFSQKDAGFISTIEEQILQVEMKPSTIDMIEKLKKNFVITGKKEVILADTSVKLMSKMHQMYSGTVKFESGNYMVLDLSKAEFIKEYFEGQKIGIFYKFVAELEAIKTVFGDSVTTDITEFKETDKSIALQIVSGREGINLKEASALVYYNIDFSATSYWQSRDRMTTIDRVTSDIYWVFAKGGIEYKIYKAVVKKKDYTVSHFKKDFA